MKYTVRSIWWTSKNLNFNSLKLYLEPVNVYNETTTGLFGLGHTINLSISSTCTGKFFGSLLNSLGINFNLFLVLVPGKMFIMEIEISNKSDCVVDSIVCTLYKEEKALDPSQPNFSLIEGLKTSGNQMAKTFFPSIIQKPVQVSDSEVSPAPIRQNYKMELQRRVVCRFGK
jgi:hypothetical protein